MAQPEITEQVLEPRRGAAPGRGRRILRWIGRGLAALLILVVVAVVAAGLWARSRVAASLPPLEGERITAGISQPVAIARDGSGIPAIQAANRRDAAFATGFVHAQDRFFQMDLVRRQAAGEMAEVLGARGLRIDRIQRTHRFRPLAQRLLREAPAEQRALVEAYARGVNAGLATLREKPFEYLVLQSEPQPWKPEDSYLVLCAMFLLLQDRTGSFDTLLGLMQDTLPPQLFTFLTPWGDEWDAPLLGEPLAAPSVPGAEVFDARTAPRQEPKAAASLGPRDPFLPGPGEMAASNAWAVAGSRTADGRALLASDMHTGLNVPPLWYRVSLSWPEADGRSRRVTGVTVPGTPIVVAGSNGRVSWGFTNSRVDTADVVLVDAAPGRDHYRTPGGPVRFRHHREILRVSGGQEEVLDVVWTAWGPLLPDDHRGRRRALRWVAHQPEALNLDLLLLESAASAGEALTIARRSGIPAQSFLAVDDAGHIGWTLAGRVPRREGFDGRTPVSWADGRRGWRGWLGPEVPQILDPESGRLWSANNRLVSGEPLARLGDGNYVHGARARQIRDRLLEIDRATYKDMLDLQLDDRALFLARWQRLLLEVLTPEAVAAVPGRREVRQLVESWGGRAAVGSAGYRLVREFRDRLSLEVLAAPLRPCLEADPDFDYAAHIDRLEAPLWRLVSERPAHFLDPRHRTWDEQLLAAVDAVVAAAAEEDTPLAEWTWGRRNRAEIFHVLGGAIPLAGRWLNMPADPLPGDLEMPRVQIPSYGASFRMVVSPGREEEGFAGMPAGASGHPLSPHYGDSHAAWVHGEPRPFLPGPAAQTLTLKPAP